MRIPRMKRTTIAVRAYGCDQIQRRAALLLRNPFFTLLLPDF
jgi:hypothetical protein